MFSDILSEIQDSSSTTETCSGTTQTEATRRISYAVVSVRLIPKSFRLYKSNWEAWNKLPVDEQLSKQACGIHADMFRGLD
jgi:hypothetical protein